MIRITKILSAFFILGLIYSPTTNAASASKKNAINLCSKIAQDFFKSCQKDVDHASNGKKEIYLSKDFCAFLSHSSCNDCCMDTFTHLINAGVIVSTAEQLTEELGACSKQCREPLPSMDETQKHLVQ